MKSYERLTITTWLLLIFFCCGTAALAQRRPPGGGPPPGFDPQFGREGGRHGGRPPFGRGGPSGNPAWSFLSSEMRFGEKTVKGAPFSAQAVNETVQTLADGTKLTQKSAGIIYRDGEGRVRREQELAPFGPFPASGDSPPRMIFINDPVAKVHYVLDPENKKARKMMVVDEPPPMKPPSSSAEAKTESLGKQTIEGVEAEGTRSTITIPVGQIGNDRPIEIVSERWYSSVLQTVVMTKYSDPRMGTRSYRLTNIKLEEPARTLFAVPADYSIEEGNFPRRDRRRGDDR
jgi:hypothetical protein